MLNIEKNKPNKIKTNWVDVSRVIGISAVLLGHINNPLQSFIFSWHMPFFFIMSGFFLNVRKSPILDSTIKDLRKLFLPFIIFTLLALVADFIKRKALGREDIDYIEKISNIIFWLDYSSLENTYAFVLWFIPALLISKLAVRTIIVFTSSKYIHLFLISIAAIVGLNFNLPLAIDNGLVAAPFVYFGFASFPTFTRLYQLKQRRLFLLGLLLLCLTLMFFIGFASVDMAVKKLEPSLYAVFWSLLVSSIVFLISMELSFGLSIFKYLSSLSMLFYIIHPYTHNIANQIAQLIQVNFWFLEFVCSFLLLLLSARIWKLAKTGIKDKL